LPAAETVEVMLPAVKTRNRNSNKSGRLIMMKIS